MLRRQADDARAPDDVEVLAVGHGGTEDAVRPVPHLLPGQGVEGIRSTLSLLRVAGGDAAAPRAGREVDQAVDYARRAVDRGRGGEAPEAVAGAGVECHEEAVVGPDVDTPLP